MKNTDAGFIKIWRKIQNWEWYSDLITRAFFLDILLRATHQDIYYRGKLIPKGSFFSSVDELAKDNKLSTKKTRILLNRLKASNQVSIKTANDGSLITICNYSSYQSQDSQKGKQKDKPNVSPRANQGQTLLEQEHKEHKEYSDHALFINFFCDCFKKKTGNKYVFASGKDGKLVKAMLGTLGIDRLKQLTEVFFDSQDEFIIKAGYSIGVLSSQINKLQYNKQPKKVDQAQATREYLDKMEQWKKGVESQEANPTEMPAI